MKKKWKAFKEARKFAQSLNLKNKDEWTAFCLVAQLNSKKPDDIPSSPNVVYKNNGWKDWPDWLGTEYIATQKRRYATYKVAQKFCQSHGITTGKEWHAYCKNNVLPKEIPARPDYIYRKDGTWKGWGEFCGTGKMADQIKARNYRPFNEAQPIYEKLAKQYHLVGYADWLRFARTHKKLLDDLRIPVSPWQTYTKERVGRKKK